MKMAKQKTPDVQRLWLRVSPFGKRSGFFVLPYPGDGLLTITVLPKMWAKQGPVKHQQSCQPGTTAHLTVYELDFVELAGPQNILAAIALDLSKVNGQVGEAQVLVVIPDTEARSAEVTTKNQSDPFNDLVDLMLVAERSGIGRTAETFGGTGGASLTRILTQERFVRSIEPLIFKARPSYSERVERLASPRGRLSDLGVLRALRNREPFLDCTFDELSMDTPLLRVVLAALHVVVGDNIPTRIRQMSPRLKIRAVQLARHLANVELLRRNQATRIASHVWIGPMQRQWEPALSLAVQVLNDTAILPIEGNDLDEVVAIHVRTEKFWEQTVGAVLAGVFGDVRVNADNTTASGVATQFPWNNPERPRRGESYPDFVFKFNERIVVADAKYKSSLQLTPPDGYQLFAYSHLTEMNESKATMGALIYPIRPGRVPSSWVLLRMPDADFPLLIVGLPFPDPPDVRSGRAWGHYISVTTQGLASIFEDQQNAQDLTMSEKA
jgi:hypothetical protein